MRISDWSSDVCSSDLTAGSTPAGADRLRKRIRQHRRERQPEGSPTMASGKSEKVATLYRMVMSDHLRPYGLKSKDLLERQGFTARYHHPKSREETAAFEKKHGVETTPQTFIDGKRIGGYDDLRRHFGQTVGEERT